MTRTPVLRPAHVAWLQLRSQTGRTLVALAGVAFAVVLMAMQLGFMDALYRSAVGLHAHLDADIILINPHYNLLGWPTAFPRRRLYQALGAPGVAAVSPLHTGLARWKHPWGGRTRELLVLGIEPNTSAVRVPGLAAQQHRLRTTDVVFFDARSRPEFGPVAAALGGGHAIATEVNGRRVDVAGLFELGTAIGIDATLLTSDVTFRRIFPQRPAGAVSLVLVQLQRGASPEAVRAALAARLPDDVAVLTRDELVAREVAFWRSSSPIGFIFTFGVAMSLLVGAVIVYQILFADIADHAVEYATLKAIGHGDGYLARIVGSQSTALAAVGFLPGIAIAHWLHGLAAGATQLPMHLEPERVALVFGLTMVMCWASGLVALRPLRATEPAEVFR